MRKDDDDGMRLEQCEKIENYEYERTRLTFDGLLLLVLLSATRYSIPGTGWFKHKTPNSFRRQCPRRFWELDPELLHTCLMCPCRAFNECFFFRFFVFFTRCLGFCIFWRYLGFKGPHIFAEKNKKTNNSIRKRLGRGTLNTWANFQGLIPVTMETRSSKVIFPNYSKKKPAEDTLVPPLWGTRGKNVRFSRIICSRCCTRRNLRFHDENSQHADQKQLTRR